MPKRTAGPRSTVIRCPNCGEDYSVTYKRCPFCDEKTRRDRKAEEEDYYDEEYDEQEDYPSDRSGGKRLASGGRKRRGARRGGPTALGVIGTIVSLAVIAAAIWIVVTQIMPLVTGEKPTPKNSPTPPVSQTVEPSPTPAATDPAGQSSPEPTPTPTPDPSTLIPSTQTATGFTLSRSDFTLIVDKPGDDRYRLTATFTPAGSIGFIDWSVDKPEVATVAEDGTVRAVSRGTATVTATMAGGVTKTCVVRVSAPAAEPSSSGGESASTPTPSGDLSLNRTDFTWYGVNEPPVQMRVNGTDSTPTWSIGNTAVATIDDSGLVRPVGPGTTRITCTVDGQTLTCMVRCNF